MTDLEHAIAAAIARTRIPDQWPAAVLAAIEGAGYVVIPSALAERALKAKGIGKKFDREVVSNELARYAPKPGDLDPSAEGKR
jgi:hypothetical protein